jgi:hypothetical protein
MSKLTSLAENLLTQALASLSLGDLSKGHHRDG